MLIPVKDAVLKKIQGEMGDDAIYHFSDRISIYADIEIFNHKEDPYVWAQKKEKIGNHFSIYFDNVFISGFDESDPIDKTMLEFWKGLKDAVEKKKLDIDPVKSAELKKAKEDALKEEIMAKKKAIEDLPGGDEVHNLAKEVVRRASSTAT